MIATTDLPAINAVLNTTSATLLLAGYLFIRSGNRKAHTACMIAALTTSAVFLVGYLVHKYFHGATRFQGPPMVRTVYLTILWTHTVLAVVIVPMIFVTVIRAARERFDKHRKIARITLPLWAYVSVTGVIVYFFLYQWYPQRAPAATDASAVLAAGEPRQTFQP